MDITDCDCATKNLRSHWVLGRITIVCDNVAFDTLILRIAGISIDLYRVNEVASDIIVLKLCCSNTIGKLLELIKSGSEDPLNIAFMAMSLYFLRTFLCTFNGDGMGSEARITILWSSLMCFLSLNVIRGKYITILGQPILEVYPWQYKKGCIILELLQLNPKSIYLALLTAGDGNLI